MDIRKIESVCSVDTFGSYSEAAYRIASSPSVIAKHIAAVEEEFGVQLFKRATKSAPVELTEAGEKLLPCFHEILRQYEKAREAANSVKAEQKELLTVGYVQQIGSFRENSILAGYTIENPDVIVLRKAFTFQNIASQMLNDTVDAIFLPWIAGVGGLDGEFNRLQSGDYVITEVMRIAQLNLGLPDFHPMAGYEVIPERELSNLYGETFLIPSADVGGNVIAPVISAKLGIPGKMKTRYVDFSEKILPCSIAESGAGLLPQLCIVPKTMGRIRFVPVEGESSPITLYLIYKKSAARRALRKLNDYVLHSSAQYYEDFPEVTVPKR